MSVFHVDSGHVFISCPDWPVSLQVSSSASLLLPETCHLPITTDNIVNLVRDGELWVIHHGIYVELFVNICNNLPTTGLQESSLTDHIYHHVSTSPVWSHLGLELQKTEKSELFFARASDPTVYVTPPCNTPTAQAQSIDLFFRVRPVTSSEGHQRAPCSQAATIGAFVSGRAAHNMVDCALLVLSGRRKKFKGVKISPQPKMSLNDIFPSVVNLNYLQSAQQNFKLVQVNAAILSGWTNLVSPQLRRNLRKIQVPIRDNHNQCPSQQDDKGIEARLWTLMLKKIRPHWNHRHSAIPPSSRELESRETPEKDFPPLECPELLSDDDGWASPTKNLQIGGEAHCKPLLEPPVMLDGNLDLDSGADMPSDAVSISSPGSSASGITDISLGDIDTTIHEDLSPSNKIEENPQCSVPLPMPVAGQEDQLAPPFLESRNPEWLSSPDLPPVLGLSHPAIQHTDSNMLS